MDKIDDQNTINAKLRGLGLLVQIQKETRDAKDLRELMHVMVNQTFQLVPYRQAIFWSLDVLGHVEIRSASSVAQLDRHAPFMVWLENVIGSLRSQKKFQSIQSVQSKDLEAKYRQGWSEWSAQHVLWCPMIHQGQCVGGLWLSRDHVFTGNELQILDYLLGTYQFAFRTFYQSQQKSLLYRLLHWRPAKRQTWYIIAGIVLFLLFPIRQSTLGPVTVVPRNPVIATSPMQGVIKKFYVQPNETVVEGQVLLSLDNTVVKNQRDVAMKGLEVAQAEYRKASQEAFTDPVSRAKLSVLEAQVQLKSAEVVYSDSLLFQSDIRADQNGIAIFNDVNEWVGRPVSVGEKILTIANSEQVQLEIFIPVDANIPLKIGDSVRAFLNIRPLDSMAGEITQISYEAEPLPDGMLAYRLKASLDQSESLPRVGLRGTAKVYGSRVPLVYYVLRRPLAAVRKWVGM